MLRLFTLITLFFPTHTFAQAWGEVAGMPIGKHHPVSFSLDGKGFAITGSNSIDVPTDDVFQYDPVENEWTELGTFPGPDRSFAIGQAYEGKGYLGFGASLTSYFNDIWEYDAETDDWSLLTTCDCSGRRHPAFIVKDDKIYVGLGDDATGDLDDWHIYDMNTDTWTQVSDIPGAGRHHPFMFPAGDHLYAGMGHSGQTIFGDWYRFNLDTESWETMADFPGEHRVAGTQFGHQGKGYVLSGDGSNHSWMPTGEFWEYDPDLDSWTELDPHPGRSRWAPGSFVINGAVFLLGGVNRTSGAVLNDMWTYQLTTPSPNSTNELDLMAEVQLYPNPAEEVIFIKSDEQLTNVRLVSLTGKLIIETTNAKSMDVSSLPTGVYFLQGETESGRIFQEKVAVK